MISINASIASNNVDIDKAEADRYGFQQSTGTLGMRRAKREGRNPSTGARTTTPFGLSITYPTGLLPLSQGTGDPIY